MPRRPPENVKRWTARRKAAVLAAVRSGAILVEEACRRYEISEEEFLAWLRAFETHGLPGLRTTRIQQYRRRRSSRGRGRKP
jgi:transposase-like protein